MTHLHVTNGDTVVTAISNNFVFDFLPSLHTALDENLRRSSESLCAEFDELLLVVSESRSESSESESSSNNDGVTDIVGGNDTLFDRVGGSRLGALLTDLLHGVGEEFTILRHDDGFDRSTEDFDAETFKFILELNTDLKSSLSSESNVDTVRSLVLDNLANRIGGDGKEVDLVGETVRIIR
jgi:hypothetical protein